MVIINNWLNLITVLGSLFSWTLTPYSYQTVILIYLFTHPWYIPHCSDACTDWCGQLTDQWKYDSVAIPGSISIIIRSNQGSAHILYLQEGTAVSQLTVGEKSIRFVLYVTITIFFLHANAKFWNEGILIDWLEEMQRRRSDTWWEEDTDIIAKKKERETNDNGKRNNEMHITKKTKKMFWDILYPLRGINCDFINLYPSKLQQCKHYLWVDVVALRMSATYIYQFLFSYLIQ